MPLDELRRRYAALGPIEEFPGERTIRTRCFTFEAMLENGSLCADLLRREMRSLEADGLDPQRACRDHPALCRLVLEAWP